MLKNINLQNDGIRITYLYYIMVNNENFSIIYHISLQLSLK